MDWLILVTRSFQLLPSEMDWLILVTRSLQLLPFPEITVDTQLLKVCGGRIVADCRNAADGGHSIGGEVRKALRMSRRRVDAASFRMRLSDAVASKATPTASLTFKSEEYTKSPRLFGGFTK